MRSRSIVRLAFALATLLLASLVTASPAQAGPINGRAYTIQNTLTGKCLDVRDATWNNGGRLQTFTCGPQWNQHFVLRKVPDIYNKPTYRLVPRYTDGQKCVDVQNGTSAGGEPLQIWSCHSGWRQMFHLTNLRGSVYQIQPVYNSLCIGVQSYGDMAPIVQWGCDRHNASNHTFQTFYLNLA